jgi:hypothetical protein
MRFSLAHFMTHDFTHDFTHDTRLLTHDTRHIGTLIYIYTDLLLSQSA